MSSDGAPGTAGSVPPTRAPIPAPTGRLRRRLQWGERADIRFALVVVLGLALLGVALGWPWQDWSPRTIALVYNAAGLVPDETEAYVAADGRFAVITASVGLVAGVLVWFRRGRRGPITVIGLAAGAVAGSYCTELVGRLTGGGTTHAAIGTILVPPVDLHARQLLAVEPLVAVLVYLLCALFAARDDLGRPEAAEHSEARAGAGTAEASVASGDQGPGWDADDQFAETRRIND